MAEGSANKALVSVIIPTFNRADRIGAAIDSVRAQLYPHIQVLVCDDGSTDDTETFIRTRYPEAEYVWIPHSGPAAARNAGLARAKGAFIVSLDSDDRWQPEFLQECVEKIQADGLDFVFANWIQEYPGGVDRDYFSRYKYLKPYQRQSDVDWQSLDARDLRNLYMKACPSPSSSALLRKSSVVAGWTEGLISDDWCILLDMILARPCRAAFTLQPLWHKKVGGDNIYDGRDQAVVTERYDISDSLILMERFKTQLLPEERALFLDRCTHGYAALARYELLRRFNPGKAVTLLRRGMALDWRRTMRAVPQVLLEGLRRHLAPGSRKTAE